MAGPGATPKALLPPQVGFMSHETLRSSLQWSVGAEVQRPWWERASCPSSCGQSFLLVTAGETATRLPAKGPRSYLLVLSKNI